jgi:tRNA threonylcarbamoyladenosine biosynthesis protein TsaB
VSQLVLAADTTHEFGSIALVDAGAALQEVLLHSAEGFGHILYEHLARLLDTAGVVLSDIACFACASGPGSFTGVRVGLACIKGLAEAQCRPVVPVSNLAALARFGATPLRAVVMDARRGDIYGALYDHLGNPVLAESVGRFRNWLETLPDGIQEFVSTDFDPFRPALAGTRFAGARIVTAPRALAAVIGQIGWERFLSGQALDPAAVDANYIRRSDAELSLNP